MRTAVIALCVGLAAWPALAQQAAQTPAATPEDAAMNSLLSRLIQAQKSEAIIAASLAATSAKLAQEREYWRSYIGADKP